MQAAQAFKILGITKKSISTNFFITLKRLGVIDGRGNPQQEVV